MKVVDISKIINCEMRYFDFICLDHPHRRGGKAPHDSVRILNNGSSPQAWGKGFHEELFLEASRIIPTGVGKSSFFVVFVAVKTDHPHRRGEK